MGFSNDKFGIITVQDDAGAVHFLRQQASGSTTSVDSLTVTTASGKWFNTRGVLASIGGTGTLTSTGKGSLKKTVLHK